LLKIKQKDNIQFELFLNLSVGYSIIKAIKVDILSDQTQDIKI